MQQTVIITETLGIERRAEPVLGGIPLPSGELHQAGWFELTGADGVTSLVEGSAAAWWPDGSIKWLHLCGLVNLAAGVANEFALKPAATGPVAGLVVEQHTAHDVSVRGGAIDLDVRADVLNLLRARDPECGRELLIAPGLSFEYQLTDCERRAYRDCRFELARDPVTAVVNSANRVVLRLAGRMLDAGAREVALVRLFVEIWRELAEIRLQPVLIPIGLPNEEMIRKFQLRVHSPVRGGDCQYTFGNAQGQGFSDLLQRHVPFGPRWPQARQVQLGSSFYKTEKRTGEHSSWVKALEGGRAQGWCQLSNATGGISAAMRYFWQEYPHSLQVDADAGTLSFGLIPEEAEPLDLRRYSPSIYGDGASHEFMYEFGSGPDEPRLSGARGIAKAHELAIRFHPAGEPASAGQLLSFLQPCRPLVPGAQFAASRVTGVLAALQSPTTSGPDEVLSRIIDFIIQEREVRGWYGLMNFGDVMMSYYSELDRWAFDDGGHAWLNTESIPDYGLWLNALRGGRIDWLEAAIEMSRHNRDVDTYHWGELKGLGSRHNVNHWGCRDKEWRVSMPLARRLHYYTTADAWTREVISETIKVYQAAGERTKANAPGFTAAFAGVLTKWELSGAAADGAVVSKLAELYAAAVGDDGRFIHNMQVDFATGQGQPVGTELAPSHSFFMDHFGGQHVLAEVAELLDHPKLKDALLRHARFRLQPDASSAGPVSGADNAVEFLAVAARHSGEACFRVALAQFLTQVQFHTEWIGGDNILEETPHQRDPQPTRRNKYVCGLGRFLSHVPFAQAEV